MLKKQQGICLAEVSGESMASTIEAGSTVVLRYYEPTLELHPLEDGQEKVPANVVRAFCRDGEIVVASINDEPPTLNVQRHEGAPGKVAAAARRMGMVQPGRKLSACTTWKAATGG